MKSNALTTILTGVLAFSVLLSVIFCLQFIFLTRDIRSINAQVNGINTYRASLGALYDDCVAYSERNQAIIPVLESVGYKRPAPTKQPGTR